MDFASQNLTADQLNAIVKKLGGEEAALRFLRGELVISTAIPAEYPIWKTVKLGLHKTPDAYRKALTKAKFRISDWAGDILKKVTVASAETELDLVKMSVADLGFKGNTRYADICARAQELGLELCPNEVGPALRLQYKEQPRSEWFRVAMEPLADSGGRLHVFYLASHELGMWLSSDYGRPGYVFDPDDVFVFVRPRK